jgi:glycosyltransferase involved in cell wall biosynthesis
MNLISLIVPFHKSITGLESLRQRLNLVKTPIEVILVIDDKLEGLIEKKNSNEKIVIKKNRGRGYNFAEGVRNAAGDIIVFLHSDTLLPENWDKAIRRALINEDVIGGAFSLAFDNKSRYMKFSIFLTDLIYLLIGELWGDRALFIRSKLLMNNLSIIEVPIMEDVRLSRWMNKIGKKVVILKEKVTTDSSAFFEYGFLRKSLRTIKARVWYSLGVDLQKIFNDYYSKN